MSLDDFFFSAPKKPRPPVAPKEEHKPKTQPKPEPVPSDATLCAGSLKGKPHIIPKGQPIYNLKVNDKQGQYCRVCARKLMPKPKSKPKSDEDEMPSFSHRKDATEETIDGRDYVE